MAFDAFSFHVHFSSSLILSLLRLVLVSVGVATDFRWNHIKRADWLPMTAKLATNETKTQGIGVHRMPQRDDAVVPPMSGRFAIEQAPPVRHTMIRSRRWTVALEAASKVPAAAVAVAPEPRLTDAVKSI